jgi:phage shock protein PspC (stress-responsive transcriptional regulator)
MDEHTTTDQTISSGPATPPPPPPAPPRRLERDTEHEVIGGVAAGIANYLGIDPVIPRVIFAVLAFTGGVGIIAYIICWIAMPEAPRGVSGGGSGDRPARGPGARAADLGIPPWAAVALIIVGVLVLAGNTGFSMPAMAWALALIGVGVLLFRQDTREQLAGVQGGPPSPVGSAGGQPGAHAAPGTGDRDTAPVWEPAPPVPAPSWDDPSWRPPAGEPPTWSPEPHPPASYLGRLTLAAILVTNGLAALLNNLGWVRVTAADHLALALVVTGIGLVVGAWFGRSRGLIVLGVVLLPVLAVAAVLPRGTLLAVEGGVGERLWEPTSVAELDDAYRLFAGEAVLDLSRLRFEPGEPATVRAQVTFGELTVLVPAGTVVEARGRAAGGEVVLFDRSQSGLGVDFTRGSAAHDGTPDLVLDVSVLFGELTVRETTPALR